MNTVRLVSGCSGPPVSIANTQYHIALPSLNHPAASCRGPWAPARPKSTEETRRARRKEGNEGAHARHRSVIFDRVAENCLPQRSSSSLRSLRPLRSNDREGFGCGSAAPSLCGSILRALTEWPRLPGKHYPRSLIFCNRSTKSTKPSAWLLSRWSNSGSFSRPASSSRSLMRGRKTRSGNR